MNRKKCSTCGEEKPLKEFYSDASRADGLEVRCKPCCKARCAKYREENKEALRAYGYKYREENKEALRAYDVAYSAKRRLKTLDALYNMPMPPTPASVIAALGDQYTRDASPVCEAADVLLAVADWGSDEWQRLQEIASELTPEWFEEQYSFQNKVITDYENSRNAAA